MFSAHMREVFGCRQVHIHFLVIHFLENFLEVAAAWLFACILTLGNGASSLVSVKLAVFSEPTLRLSLLKLTMIQRSPPSRHDTRSRDVVRYLALSPDNLVWCV